MTTRRLARLSVALLTPLGVVGAIAATADPIVVNQRLVASVLSPLANRFARTTDTTGPPVTGFVVLGGHTARVREAIRLADAHPGAKIVITGADEADYRQLEGHGFEPGRVVVERLARTTFENAILTKRLLRPQRHERWLLVTSATHMPRAIGTFTRMGFTVEPWPVDDVKSGDVQAADVLKHELIGLVVYWLQGRTAALFPAPD